MDPLQTITALHPTARNSFFELMSTLVPMNATQRNKVLEYTKLIAAAEGK